MKALKKSLLESLSRRRVLRGMLAGSAVTVGLPLLDCFLNDNGTAFASGEPIPVRFGTWFWGLGMNRQVFVPKTVGPNFDLPPEIEMLAPVRQHINLYTGFDAERDSAPLLCHYTGWIISRSGTAPMSGGEKPAQTIDTLVAAKLGRTTRYQSLTATSDGDQRTSFSYEDATSVNDAEPSPVNFYKTLFGPGYQDPNASTFTPDPRIMARRSVLSGVMEQTRAVERTVGTTDRARLDQYFAQLRDLERQFDIQLTKPEPIDSCHKVDAPKKDPKISTESTVVALRHNMMTDLLVMALACDQTRVFNMAYSAAFASTIRAGYDKPHHTDTHEEPVDEKLGYQPITSWFLRRSMESWAYFVGAFAKVKEGNGTLLDNTLILATTDSSWARIHSVTDLPMFTAGRAGGRIKSGIHVVGDRTPVTRLGYTCMKVLGLDINSWGTQSNKTDKEITEILA